MFNVKNPRLVIYFVLANCMILSNCSINRPTVSRPEEHNTYTVAQLQEFEDLYNYVLKKEVLIHKKNNEVISGHFYEMKNDSTTILLKGNEDSKRRIPNHEIRSIVLRDNGGTLKGHQILKIVAVVVGFAFIMYALKQWGDAY